MTAIFISHSSADNAAAAEMKAWLEAHGHTLLFLDFDPEGRYQGWHILGADALSATSSAKHHLEASQFGVTSAITAWHWRSCALEQIEVSTSERRITHRGFESCSAQVIPTNSVVMSSRAPIGHLAINTVPVCTNQGCKSFVPKTELNTRYLYWALRSAMPEIQHRGDGGTFDEVSKADLEAFEIPIPPFAEQQRLVARIEGLTSRLERA